MRQIGGSISLSYISWLVASSPSRPSVSMYNISTLLTIQMRIVDFADMLQGSISEKIKVCKGEIDEEIEALDWVQGQIQHLVINNESKDTKVRI